MSLTDSPAIHLGQHCADALPGGVLFTERENKREKKLVRFNKL